MMKNSNSNKLTKTNQLLYRWIMLKILDEFSIEDAILVRGYKTIVLYGYTHFCEAILLELSHSDQISIPYILDRRASDIESNMSIYKLEDLEEEMVEGIDAVIICIPIYADELRNEISNYMPLDILDLEELLYEI